MSFEFLNLRPITQPRLDEGTLRNAISGLQRLTSGMEEGGSPISSNLLKDLRDRLIDGMRNGLAFEEYTAVKRREWLLLSLYLNDLSLDESRALLPPLDKNHVTSILGDGEETLKPHIRRLATQLYFTHYGRERLPCLDILCWMLGLAWRSAVIEKLDPISKVWAEHARTLFAADAPEKIAATWKSGMTAHELADSFNIHEGGLFRERLLEALILNRLRNIPMTEKDLELNEQVINEKDRKMVASGLRLGAEAVRILVVRSQEENDSTIPATWSDQLVSFACDPRIPNNDMRSRWWGWATSAERDMAIRALSKISLEEFIRLLEKSLIGTPQGHQFPARRNLLQRLFDKGYVNEARLVVPRRIYQGLEMKTKEVLRPSWLTGSQDTSFVCLRCANDVYLIEGTHSFSLRGFIGSNSFPIRGYWESEPKQLADSQFRVHESNCQIYQRHLGRYWAGEFIHQLRRRHIEWEIFR